MGYVAMEADCASRAKEILLAEPAVQLVLTDLKMPGNLSGLDLAHWVRLTLPRMKILIATALNEVAGAAEAAADGIPILEKPYTKLQLARAVHDALEFHPA